MKMEEYNKLAQDYICGNISDFKEQLNKLSKKELLEFIEFAQEELNLNALDTCMKYLE